MNKTTEDRMKEKLDSHKVGDKLKNFTLHLEVKSDLPDTRQFLASCICDNVQKVTIYHTDHISPQCCTKCEQRKEYAKLIWNKFLRIYLLRFSIIERNAELNKAFLNAAQNVNNKPSNYIYGIKYLDYPPTLQVFFKKEHADLVHTAIENFEYHQEIIQEILGATGHIEFTLVQK